MHVRTIALCAAVLLMACGPHRTVEPAPLAGDQPVSGDDELVLEVSNNNWSDVVIYMVRDGRRTRFTVVTAARSASVAIPSRFISSNRTVQIVARRIGGNDEYLSPAVSVRLGHTVALTLESNLVRSSVGVW
jgi:hypothetical protein